MASWYSSRNCGPLITKVELGDGGYFVYGYRYQGGLLPDLVSVRYVSYDDCIWC